MSRSQQALAIAANIALARQVYDIPEDPITHDPIATFQNRLPPPELYHLPAQKEVELAHALAVTSKLKDESDYTSAVTVTEDPKRRRLLVLLAVNRASPEDGQEELDGAHAALERVLDIMSEVRSRNNNGMQDRILGAVVTACHAKILARMGLAPCRHNKTRMPLDGKLSQAVYAVNTLTWQKPPGAEEFSEHGTTVLELIAKWRQAPDDIDRLVAVVDGLHKLHENVPSLDNLMSKLPSRIIVPSAAKSIAAVVAKTAYYVRVARTLYRTAKKYPIARRARIIPINLPPIAFAQTPLPMHGTPGAAAVLSRDTKIKSLCSGAPPATLQTIVRYLNSSAKASRAGESFEEVMHTSLTGRIHAEMQIIYYCNMPENCHILSPRAVCASKASCFLCNSYVTAHGSVYVPFSHGRLYTNWRLPNMSGLEIPEAAFVGRLETTVTWGLGLLSAYGHAPQRPEPAQSVVMGLTGSTTTLGDLGSYDAELEDAEVWYTEDEMENYVDEITEHGDDDDELELETEPHLIRGHDDDDEQNNLMDEYEDEDEEVQDSGPYQNGVSVNGTNPYGSNPLGTNPMGTNPMGTNPMGTNPFGTNPMGSAPHGSAFTAPVIVSSHRELANETADVETAPTTPEPESELQQVEALAAAKREPVASSESDPLSLPERPKQHFIRAQSAPVSSSSASRPEPLAASVTEAVVEEQVVEAEIDEAIDTDAGSDLAVSEMSERPSAPDLRTQSVSEPLTNTHRPAVPTPPTHAATPFVLAEHERRESGAYAASYQSTAVSDGSVSDGDIEARDKPSQVLRSSASTRPVVVNSTVESAPSPIVEPVVQVVEVANTAKVAESVATSVAEPEPQPDVVAEPVTVPVPVAVAEPATQSPEIPAKAAARELKEEPAAAETLVPTVVKDAQPVAQPDAEPKPELKTTVEPPAVPVVVAAPAELTTPGTVYVADFGIPSPAVAPAPAAVEVGVPPKAEVSETMTPAEPAASASAQTTVPDQAPVSAPTPTAPISAQTVAPVAAVNQTPAPAQAAKDTTANIAPAPISVASGSGSETPLKKGLRYRLKSLFKKGNKTAAAAAK
ncbi:hypothetical protein CFIMG_003357RA [Ceratocystis fimbriata CBS 114723]|uniref:Uncharacterized protein n=1 Tax=Ceratocystis fimbriata CBS 114723 TaxID=1035309 RepID=A0A2C5X0P9_9PEZI|nr:hypothetical protein CFIMG_003357RA [Ceratocystis fimbriata CBS 114723]